MIRYARFESPLGPCSPSPTRAASPTSTSSAPIRTPHRARWIEDPASPRSRLRPPARRIFRRDPHCIRPAARAARLGLPAARLARDRTRSVRQDHQLRRAREARGRARPGARRGRGHGTQPRRRRDPLPSHRRRRRQPHRLRRRPRAQARAAGAGGRVAEVARLRPADVARLVALGAMWGASYLFMRVAVPHLGAPLMIELRVLVAGLLLAAFLYGSGRTAGWRRHWRSWLVVGVIGTAVPFVLIAEALRSIDASTAAILNALVPLSPPHRGALIREPITPPKAAGIALASSAPRSSSAGLPRR